jgi:hypothetical protein
MPSAGSASSSLSPQCPPASTRFTLRTGTRHQSGSESTGSHGRYSGSCSFSCSHLNGPSHDQSAGRLSPSRSYGMGVRVCDPSGSCGTLAPSKSTRVWLPSSYRSCSASGVVRAGHRRRGRRDDQGDQRAPDASRGRLLVRRTGTPRRVTASGTGHREFGIRFLPGSPPGLDHPVGDLSMAMPPRRFRAGTPGMTKAARKSQASIASVPGSGIEGKRSAGHASGGIR